MKNIYFKTLTISNFLSFGKEISIPLNNDGISIITGYNLDREDGNGCGKSTVIDAFFFALFGDTLKELKKEAIVNNMAKKGCKVTLTFDVDQNGVIKTYRIERGLAPSYCKIFVGEEEEKTLSTIPVTNNYILNLINSTATVFKNTITMRLNNTIPFMAQRKNEKRSFIEGILRLELFKIMNKIARDNYDTLFKDYEFTNKSYEDVVKNIQIYTERKTSFEKNRKEKIDDLLNRKSGYEKEVDELKTKIVNVNLLEYQKLVETLEKRNAEIDKLDKQKNTLNGTIIGNNVTRTNNTTKITGIDAELLRLKRQFEKFPKTDLTIDTIEAGELYIKTAKKTLETLKTSNIEKNRDIKDLENNIKKIQSIGSFCDKCKRPFEQNNIEQNKKDVEQAKTAIDKITQEIAQYTQDIENNNTTIGIAEIIIKMLTENDTKKKLTGENEKITTDIEKAYKDLSTIENTIKTEKNNKTTEQTQKDTIQAQIIQNKNLDALIQKTQTSITHCINDIKKTENENNEFVTLITTSEANKIELEKKITAYKEKVAIYDVIKYVVSDEGAKATIIKRLIGILNEKIAYYLVKMNANCQLTFDEYFEDRIIDDKGNECSYENFSGGEQKRIDLACLFSFMDLRRLQGDVAFNLSFYDELLDSALSVDGSKQVFDILKERFNDHKETAYVVTHKKENLKNPLINDIIYLEKSGGITRLGEYKI
jgi:DNA repair exonuclease SbcCD ATPase subunit